MTTRVLPIDEWPRLAGTGLDVLTPHLRPADTQIVVVEDAAGAIVGCWAVLKIVHVEGVWVAPEHRKRGSVAKRLLVGMRQAAARWGVGRVVTAAIDDEVREILAKLHAEKLPGDHYVIPLQGEQPCPSV